MRGGSLICMIDNLYAEPDSLQMSREVIAYDRGLNLDDLLFHYGVRINQDLVEDMQNAQHQSSRGQSGRKAAVSVASLALLSLAGWKSIQS